MKHIKNSLERRKLFYTLLTIIWVGIVIILSLISPTQTKIKPPLFEHFDKVVHFVFYFTMAFLFMRLFKEEMQGFKEFYKRGIAAFLITFFVGIFIEFLQENMTKTRSFDVKDVYANTFGTVVALLLVKLKKL